MKMKLFRSFYILAFMAISGLFACAGNQNQESTTQNDVVALEKEVIAVHDEVMPKMGDIARLSEVLDSEAMNPNLDSLTHASILQVRAELNAGDSLMWDWMHNYNKPEGAPLDTLKAYLLSEKERVTKVRTTMLEAIRHAESLAQKLGHGQQN